MTEELFDSSDSVRTAGPLPYAQYATFDEPLVLAGGGRLEQLRVAYETHGTLSEARDNAVLICHALSGDSHVASHNEKDTPGWWEVAVGPGRAFDTDKYFVVCPNILGGCRGTSGPNSLNPATGRPYGPDFPQITVADIVEVHRRLLDYLEIDVLLAAAGGSMGGMQVLEWAATYPHRIRGAIPVATAPRLTSQALALDVIGRNVITHDPSFRGGNYYDVETPPSHGVFAPAYNLGGLAIARMIGHISYLSREAMRDKFGEDRRNPRQIDSRFEKDTSVASYLAYQGDRFVDRFDANSYVLISRAMDDFDMGRGHQLAHALAPACCRWLVISFTSDWLFPADQSQEIVDALLARDKSVSYCNVGSTCGHDAFLLGNDIETYGPLVGGFLDKACNSRDEPDEPEADGQGRIEHHDTSIFHGRRLDYDLLEQMLVDEGGSPESAVLDLGCGGGQLLQRLRRKGWRRLQGVEIDQRAVAECVGRGTDCTHADLNDGLDRFGDRQFAFVLLSRTLQAVYDVDRVVDSMLRVGRRSIISFPNYAYEPLRKMLYEQGRAPEAPGLLRHHWYDTPNIRFFSISDFQEYCRAKGITVHRLVALNTEARGEVTDDPNRHADLAIFVISRETR